MTHPPPEHHKKLRRKPKLHRWPPDPRRRGAAQAAGRYQRGDVVGGGSSAARATRTLGAGSVRWPASAVENASSRPSTASARTPKLAARATKSGVWRSTPYVAAPDRRWSKRSIPYPPSSTISVVSGRRSCATVASSPHANRKPPSPETDTTGPDPASAAPSDWGNAQPSVPHPSGYVSRRGAGAAWKPPSQ